MAVEPATLPALVAKSTQTSPDAEAVDGTSYKQFEDLTDQYVSGLKTAGVKKGQFVCLFFGHKSIHGAALGLAIMRVSAVHVPLDPAFPAQRLLTQCRTIGAGITLLVHGSGEKDQPQVEAVGKELRVKVQAASALISEASSDVDESSWDELAIVLFTSGSTGPPKAVAYKHKHLSTSLQACTTALGFSSKTRVCNIVPYVWDGGNLDLYGPLIVGGTVCYCHELTVDGIAKTIAEQQCTVVLMAPSFFAAIPLETMGKLEVLVSAGESPSPGLFKEWGTKLPNTRVMNVFGLTETGIINTLWKWPRNSASSSTRPEISPIPLGQPIGENAIFIDGEKNEIVVAGPQIPEGYLGRDSAPDYIPPPSKFSDTHYAMRTGDQGWQDERGEYHIGGRLDGRLSIFSVRIEPADTENAAYGVEQVDFAHLFVHECSADMPPALVLAYHIAGEPGPEPLLSPGRYAEYADTHEKRLREGIRLQVPGFQFPSTYLPLGAVPRLVSGKKDGKRIASLAVEAQEKGLVKFEHYNLDV